MTAIGNAVQSYYWNAWVRLQQPQRHHYPVIPLIPCQLRLQQPKTRRYPFLLLWYLGKTATATSALLSALLLWYLGKTATATSALLPALLLWYLGKSVTVTTAALKVQPLWYLRKITAAAKFSLTQSCQCKRCFLMCACGDAVGNISSVCHSSWGNKHPLLVFHFFRGIF